MILCLVHGDPHKMRWVTGLAYLASSFFHWSPFGTQWKFFDAELGTSQVRFGPAVDGIVPALIARFKGIPIARTGSGIPCSSNTLGIGRRRRRCDYQTHGPLTWCRTTTMTTAATVATSRRLVATSPSTHRTAKGWVTVQCSKQQG